MSKRQELRERHRQARLRSRILVIGLVILIAILITLVLIIPGIKATQSANATNTAAFAGPVVVTPQAYTAQTDGRSLGDPHAPVKVVVYEDFRWSGCKNYSENLEPAFIHKYVETGKVHYTYAFFLTIDSMDHSGASRQAANAALCAAEQNKFWEYHDTLFANQFSESADLFSDARLVKMAGNLHLDMNAFNQCFQSKKDDAEIENDLNAVNALQMDRTPSVVVNGVLLPSYSQLDQAVDSALAGG